MTKILKFKKYIISVMIALAILSSAFAFSVSYAKWEAPTGISLSGMRTGVWKINPTALILDDGASYAFTATDNVYTTSFTVEDGASKKFNIFSESKRLHLKIGTVADAKNNGCEIESGDINYDFATTGAKSGSKVTYDGTYFVFAGNGNISVIFVPKDTSGDFSLGFDSITGTPNTMKAFLGSAYRFGNNYYGIITSNGDRVKLNTETKTSELFTLSAGEQFAMIVDDSRVQGRNEGVVMPDGISKLTSGAKDNIFTATKTGTYYVTYIDAKNLTIRSAGYLEFIETQDVTDTETGETVTAELVADVINFVKLDGNDAFIAYFDIADGGSRQFKVKFDYFAISEPTVAAGSADCVSYDAESGVCTATGDGTYAVTVDGQGNTCVERTACLGVAEFTGEDGFVNTVEITDKITFEVAGGANKSFKIYLDNRAITPFIAAASLDDVELSEEGVCTTKSDGIYTLAVTQTINGMTVSVVRKDFEQEEESAVISFIGADGSVESLTMAADNGVYTLSFEVEQGTEKSFKIFVGGVEVTALNQTAAVTAYDGSSGFTTTEWGTYTVTVQNGVLTVTNSAIESLDGIEIRFADADGVTGETLVLTNTDGGNVYTATFVHQKNTPRYFDVFIGNRQIILPTSTDGGKNGAYVPSNRGSYDADTGRFTADSGSNLRTYTVTVTVDGDGTVISISVTA